MAQRRYAGDGQDTNTANTTIVELRSATTIRPAIYDLVSGSDATPADNAAEYNLQRTTTVGTDTNVTATALDPGDPAALANFNEAHSAEPTFTADAILLNYSHNMRATFRWVAAPDGELKLPAADNGVATRVITVAGSAVNMTVSNHWYE